MLRPDGYVKVLDFGLARQAGASRADDELTAGTIGYMSPEEVLQRPITAASDIFSLGIVLYELASGTNPFRGEFGRRYHKADPGDGRAAFAGPRQRHSPGTQPLVACNARQVAGGSSHRFRSCVAPRGHRSAAPVPPPDCLGCRRTCPCLCSAAWPRGAWRRLHRTDSTPVLLQSLPLTSEPASETGPAFSTGRRQCRLRLRLRLARDSSHPDSQRVGPASGATA